MFFHIFHLLVSGILSQFPTHYIVLWPNSFFSLKLCSVENLVYDFLKAEIDHVTSYLYVTTFYYIFWYSSLCLVISWTSADYSVACARQGIRKTGNEIYILWIRRAQTEVEGGEISKKANIEINTIFFSPYALTGLCDLSRVVQNLDS